MDNGPRSALLTNSGQARTRQWYSPVPLMAAVIPEEGPLPTNTDEAGWPDRKWPNQAPVTLVQRGVAAAGGDWAVRVRGRWCTAEPVGSTLPGQGWKLHLSGTPDSVLRLLAAALPVLLPERCAFRVAAGLDDARWLTSAGCPRSAAGKCVTAYPAGAGQFRRLAAALHRATAGLAGPEILSDRQYQPGSVVYYRFGAVANPPVLDDEGCYRPVVVAPDGGVVQDRQDAWFAPPAWASPVLPGAGPDQRDRPAGSRSGVLVGGRFVVVGAIRHSTRGGVFEGYDRETGAAVVVKQARAHIEVDPSGRDCRDRLRQEARLLDRLAGVGVAPRALALVAEADRVLLVKERMAGTTLRQWVGGQAEAGGVPPAAGLAMARALVRLVEAVHRTGLVLVDVSPDNVVVDPTGVPWLVDLDAAADAGQPGYPVGTPGYLPPEHQAAGGRSIPARPEADLFGLGGLLFLIATGADPALAPDGSPARPVPDRLRPWLTEACAGRPLADRLVAPVLGLMCQQPEGRWPLAAVQQYLQRPQRAAWPRRPQPELPGADRLISDAARWLAAGQVLGADRLWPSGEAGDRTDPCAVQHGAAGVLAGLVAAAPHAGEPELVRNAVALTCRWLEARLRAEPRVLPGLYSGRSGTAWALRQAALLLGDRGLAERAVELALRVPLDGPCPDIAHGLAGAGVAQLYLWAASGDARFGARVLACADRLVETAEPAGGQVCWPIPATLWSSLAGRTYHGYAHGTAGIGAFLLAAGAATGQPRYTELAIRAARTLAAAASRGGRAAWWPLGPGSAAPAGVGWCTGSAGIGAFLLQAWQVGGDPRLLRLARAAAAGVHQARIRTSPAASHGLAGGGHLLLDLAGALTEPRYRDWAEDLARMVAARTVHRGGRLLVPDETGLGVLAGYGTGLAGVLAFLVRLRHGGRAPWTADWPTSATPVSRHHIAV
jgi:hypothetical protein